MEKSEIRRAVGEARKTLKSEHAEKSRAIAAALLSSARFLAYRSYFIYVGTGDEVFTKALIAALLRMGKRVFAPRTEKDGIAAVEVFPGTRYRPGAYGIEEPDGEASREPIDLAVVPMVAFDPSGNRLGHGKGYYDRYLRDFKGVKLGLAFEYQRTDAIPTDPFDVPMDAVLTERSVYPESARKSEDDLKTPFSGSEHFNLGFRSRNAVDPPQKKRS